MISSNSWLSPERTRAMICSSVQGSCCCRRAGSGISEWSVSRAKGSRSGVAARELRGDRRTDWRTPAFSRREDGGSSVHLAMEELQLCRPRITVRRTEVLGMQFTRGKPDENHFCFECHAIPGVLRIHMRKHGCLPFFVFAATGRRCARQYMAARTQACAALHVRGSGVSQV